MWGAERNKAALSLLYVEDEIITRTTIYRMLMARYETVHAAGDGREGLELFSRHRPDIVLTDTRMPILDGIRMARAIREIDAAVPIILITADDDPNLKNEMCRLNITKKLTKPVMMQELMAVLKEVGDGLERDRPTKD